jgi:hypothetical protein
MATPISDIGMIYQRIRNGKIVQRIERARFAVAPSIQGIDGIALPYFPHRIAAPLKLKALRR